MKILRLSLKNINSLRGSHILDFENAPLKGESLFAIIGPTGSGKSSILDAITLALFNQVPRFDRKITKTEIADLGSIVTHFESEAKAEIVYSSNGKTYLSKWSISKTKTGNWRDYSMELSDYPNGEFHDLKKGEVPAANERIIGLRYTQFIRAIVLSQGEFSKFLKANKNERGQLLEDITGSFVYRKIGERAYRKAKDQKEAIKREEERLAAFKIFSEEEKKSLKRELEETEKARKVGEKEIKILSENLQRKQQLLSLKEKLVKIETSESHLKNRESQLEEQRNALKKHDLLVPWQVQISAFKESEKQTLSLEKEIEKGNKFVLELQEAKKQVLAEMADLFQVNLTSENLRDEMRLFENKIIAWKTEHVANKERIKEISSRIDMKIQGQSPKTKAAFQEFDRVEEKLEYVINSTTKCEKFLAPFSDLRSLSDLEREKERDGLRDKERDLNRFLQTEDKKKELQRVVKDGEIEVKELLAKSELLLKEEVKNSAERIALQDKLEKLRMLKEQQVKIRSLEGHRADLKEGEACPLCGAKEHPFAQEHNLQIEGWESETKEVNGLLVICEKAIKQTTIQLAKGETAKGAIEKNIAQAKLNLKDINEVHQQLTTKLGLGNNVSPIADLIAEAEKRGKELSQVNAGERALQFFKEVLPDLNLLKQCQAKELLLKEEQQLLFKIKEPIKHSNALQEKYALTENKLQETKTSLKEKKVQLETVKSKGSKLSADLLPALATLGWTNINLASAGILSDKLVQTYRQQQSEFDKQQAAIEKEKKLLLKDKEQLEEHDDKSILLEELEKSLTEKKTQRDQQNEKRGTLLQQLKDDEERSLEQKAALKALEKTKLDSVKWSDLSNMIGDSKGSRFSNFAQGLTLNHLLALANQRLKSLSDRYLFDKANSDDNHLRVIDQYQANTNRAVNTLSGGESFLLSLALALSLSDLASKNVQLESLFIDEGFGTLDRDTLEMALNTLEKIQEESNKSIGIISHVDALKERIHTQVQLKKSAQGYSSIEIVQN